MKTLWSPRRPLWRRAALVTLLMVLRSPVAPELHGGIVVEEPVVAFGFPHVPLEGALLRYETEKGLGVFSSQRQSGAGGFSVFPGEAAGFELELGADEVPAGDVDGLALTRLRTADGAVIEGLFLMARAGGAYRGAVDLGAIGVRSHRLVVLRDGEVVAESDEAAFEIATLPRTVGFSAAPDGGFSVFLRFDRRQEVGLGGRRPVSGDEVVVTAFGKPVLVRSADFLMSRERFTVVDERVAVRETRSRALGDAIVESRGDQLVVSNLGGAGEDGINMRFDPSWRVPAASFVLGDIRPEGDRREPAHIEFCALGGSQEEPTPLGSLRIEELLEKPFDSLVVMASFPSSQGAYRVELYSKGELVHERIEVGEQVVNLPSSAWPRRLAVDAEAPLNPSYRIGWDEPVVARLPDNRELEIDDARVYPARPTGFDIIAEACIQGSWIAEVPFLDLDIKLEPILIDLSGTALEVTQAVQDLQNSVRLVTDKRTFARFHVRATNGDYPSFAQLRVRRGSNEKIVYPSNGFFGHIEVKENPDRAELNDSFLFELPSGFRQGVVELTASLNPITPWRSHSPLEFNYANNTVTRTVVFEDVPKMPLVLYRAGVRVDPGADDALLADGTIVYPSHWQLDRLVSWLRRAYPVRGIRLWKRSTFFGDGPPDLEAQDVNNSLAAFRAMDTLLYVFNSVFGSTSGMIPPEAHYYALVDDRAGFLRGRGGSSPPVASGPTGGTRWANPGSSLFWDDDGTYGDWYGAHELGHTFARGHANFCGAVNGPSYPYASGRISPTLTGPTALYGFDFGPPRRVYPPDWTDVMSYCDFEWVSDFTYEALMNRIQLEFPDGGGAGLPVAGPDAGRRLLITGSIDDEGARFLTPFALPDVGAVIPREPGDHTIVLRSKKGEILARYPFSPGRAHTGPADPLGEDRREEESLIVSQFVPLVEGTGSVDILWPGGVRTIRPGAAEPNVEILSPDGGEVFGGDVDEIVVSWEAEDPDGDPLGFSVEYSPDGRSWIPARVLNDSEARSVAISVADLPSGASASFRVRASDGLHTSEDVSDAPFVLENRPPSLRVVGPTVHVFLSPSDNLVLGAVAYDADTGLLDDESIRWISDRDGLLGTGSSLTVSGLGPGQHAIVAEASDGRGGVATAAAPPVFVFETPLEVPLRENRLVATPAAISFDVGRGVLDERIEVLNENPARDIRFRVTTDSPWIEVEVSDRTTPGAFIARYREAGLPPGTHEGTVELESPLLPGERVEVRATVIVPEPEEPVETGFLRGDTSDDGKINVTDAIVTLGCLFLGEECPRCPDAADVNDDGAINVTDVIYSLSFSFIGGAPPPPPFPRCGADRTPDRLGECRARSCR